MRKLWLKTAELAGSALHGLANTVPGIGGAACVCIGLGLIYLPLGVISAGAFLLLIDYRRP